MNNPHEEKTNEPKAIVTSSVPWLGAGSEMYIHCVMNKYNLEV